MQQGALVSGFYACSYCGNRECERVRRTRRFLLCDACWAAIMPQWEQEVRKGRPPSWYVETEEQRAAMGRYWDAYSEMIRAHPRGESLTRSSAPWRFLQPTPTADEQSPLCTCGREREPALYSDVRGLWGGPFKLLCPVCDALANVEGLMRMADAIHPEWDDEEWMDYLAQQYPRYFELGVLPDAWFAARLRQQQKDKDNE